MDHRARLDNSRRASLEAILATGRNLIAARSDLHMAGQFEAMVEHDLPFGPRAARMLMVIAEDPRLMDRKHASVQPSSWYTLYQITRLNNATFDRLVRDGIIRPDVERHEIVQHAAVVRSAELEWPRADDARALWLAELWVRRRGTGPASGCDAGKGRLTGVRDIAVLPQPSIIRHQPELMRAEQAKADAMVEYAARVEDWPLLEKAVDLRIKQQKEFITAWQETGALARRGS